MRKIILFILLWLMLCLSIQAQEAEYSIYLPIIFKVNNMSDWKVVTPEQTVNYAINPSFEVAGNFAAAGGATVTQSTTYQKFGLYSGRIETAGDDEGVDITLSTLSNAVHYVSVFVRGTLPTSWDWSLNGADFASPTLLKQIDSNWAIYGLSFSAAQANGSTELNIYQNGAGAGDFYLDGLMIEQKDGYRTTYCDGSQSGCEWNGAENASTSTRSALSRAGGRVYDLQDDYYLNIGQVVGAGSAPQRLGLDSYAILPGGEFNNLKIQSRVFTITGVINASSQADFHDKEQNLYDILSDAAYPGQPVLLRYEGGTVHKEIAAFYEGGLEGDVSATDPCYWERVAIRFNAPDPFWYEIGNSAAVLDTNDSATFANIARRSRSTGQWEEMGPPDAAGTYNGVYAIAEDDTYVYIGGTFSNWDNIANADNIVRYNKSTGAYSAMNVGANAIVRALGFGSDGNLYVGGDFSSIGGVATTGIAYWDGSNFSALGGAGTNGSVRGLAFGQGNILYICGVFTTVDGGAANRIAAWDILGSSWSALGAGLDNYAESVDVTNDNILYVGGGFANAGGSAASKIASYDIDNSTWSALGTGITGTVQAVKVNRITNDLYIGGNITAAGGISTQGVAKWNGTSWSALGDGLTGNVWRLTIDQNSGELYVVSSGLSLYNTNVYLSIWNGYTWIFSDFTPPGNPNSNAIFLTDYDPIIEKNKTIYQGFSTTGTGYFNGAATITMSANIPTYPKINYTRSGGTTAVIKRLRNETYGLDIYFNYVLDDGETLTIDMAQKKQDAISDLWGSRQDAILANSDLGSFVLYPGSNNISTFVDVTGAPTITAWAEWRQAYSSY